MGLLVTALTLLGMSVTPLSPAELRVYSGGAPQETLKLLAPEFEKTTGHRVAFTFAVVGAIRQRLEAGEKADVVLLPAPLIDALEKIVFASDCPFDPEGGTMYPRETLKILDSLNIPKADREKIDYKNLEAVTGVKLVK